MITLIMSILWKQSSKKRKSRQEQMMIYSVFSMLDTGDTTLDQTILTTVPTIREQDSK